MKKIAKLVAIALAIVPAALASSAQDAQACGEAISLEPIKAKPSPVQEIARAEKLLETNQKMDAAMAVLGTVSNIRTITPGKNPIETRALRVFALAVVRSNGGVTERTAGQRSQTEWTPAANMEWAAQALREIDGARPNDPTVQADLGEALAKLPLKQDEALKLLGGLEKKDLMGSPFAYAALAKMRGDKGDTSGQLAAIKRCEEMSKVPGVCKPATPAAPATTPASKTAVLKPIAPANARS